MHSITLWTYCRMSLFDVTGKIAGLFELGTFYWDCENVWEWCANEDDDQANKRDITFNFSRSHREGDDDYEAPLSMTFTKSRAPFKDSDIEIMAMQIATLLGNTVYWGNQIYLEGNDYEYQISKTFQPEYLVINYIIVNRGEIIVGATNRTRWQWDIEEGDPGLGANAKTLACGVLEISETGAVKELIELEVDRTDPLRPFVLSQIEGLLETAWKIYDNSWDQKRGRAELFGQTLHSE